MNMISNNDLTIDEKIKVYLQHYGITDELIIPEQEKEMLLMLLSETNVSRIFVEDGDLIVESSREENE